VLARIGRKLAFRDAYPETKTKGHQKRRTTMKTALRNITMIIGLTAVLGSALLFAQNESKAKIPFDFQIAKGQTLPAGEYLVKLTGDTRMLTFRNVATGHSSIVLAHPFKSGSVEEPILTFRHDGERYRLESAWFAGVQGGYGPLGGKRDRADSERGLVATVRLLQK
jgi:hypothetical protein